MEAIGSGGCETFAIRASPDCDGARRRTATGVNGSGVPNRSRQIPGKAGDAVAVAARPVTAAVTLPNSRRVISFQVFRARTSTTASAIWPRYLSSAITSSAIATRDKGFDQFAGIEIAASAFPSDLASTETEI